MVQDLVEFTGPLPIVIASPRGDARHETLHAARSAG
jgi:hypothetical protein